MSDKEIQLIDGVWYRAGEAYQHICCDCALTHDVEYRMDDGVLFYRWTRNSRETERQRATGEYPLGKPKRKRASRKKD